MLSQGCSLYYPGGAEWSLSIFEFKEANEHLDSFTDVVTFYIKFVEYLCIPAVYVRACSNNKQLFSEDIIDNIPDNIFCLKYYRPVT